VSTVDSGHISTAPMAKIVKVNQESASKWSVVKYYTDDHCCTSYHWVIHHNLLLNYYFSEKEGWVESESSRTTYLNTSDCPKYITILGHPTGLRAEKLFMEDCTGYAPVDPRLGCVCVFEFYAKIIKIN